MGEVGLLGIFGDGHGDGRGRGRRTEGDDGGEVGTFESEVELRLLTRRSPDRRRVVKKKSLG